jgi:hypothetical protein
MGFDFTRKCPAKTTFHNISQPDQNSTPYLSWPQSVNSKTGPLLQIGPLPVRLKNGREFY